MWIKLIVKDKSDEYNTFRIHSCIISEIIKNISKFLAATAYFANYAVCTISVFVRL